MRHSFSSWATFEQCPRKFKYAYVDRLPKGPPHPNAQRGTDIHNSIEQFMNQTTEQLHPEIHKTYGHYMTILRNDAKCTPELRWFLDETMTITFDKKDAWVTGFFDLFVRWDDTIDIKEWKTGKVYDDHRDQRFLYGTVGLLTDDEIEEVEVETVYFDQNQKHPTICRRDDLQFMVDTWGDRFRAIETAIENEVFPPYPQFMCKYCHFSKQNGGPCEF